MKLNIYDFVFIILIAIFMLFITPTILTNYLEYEYCKNEVQKNTYLSILECRTLINNN